jgi:hypothetical protein
MSISLIRPRYRCGDNFKIDLKKWVTIMGAEVVCLSLVSSGRCCENVEEPLDSIKVGPRWGGLY